MERLSIVVFAGFGGRSSMLLKNVRMLRDALRSEGFNVEYSEVRVPMLDDEFEGFVLVNGFEVYVPAVEVDARLLADYVVWRLASLEYDSVAGFPLPPKLVSVS